MQSSGSDESAAVDLGPRYRCLRELGRGAKGRVFLVEDAFLETRLALKWLHEPPAAEVSRRFQREFALLARIEHPRIARAHDFGVIEGRPFFTSDFIDGAPLHACRKLGSSEEALEFLAAAAEPLAFLHRNDLLHLDVKPSNVIAVERTGRLEPVLIDFGLFRQGLQALDTPGPGASIEGSLPFMGPECFRGGAIGPWTDVYALGAAFYWLIAGRFPRWRTEQPDTRELVHGPWEPAPPLPQCETFEVAPDLVRVILKCISLDPTRRFQSAAELVAALSTSRAERAVRPRVSSRGFAGTVGRSGEIRELDRFVSRISQRDAEPRVLFVTGAQGLGQSHLFRELKMRAQVAGVTTFLEVGYAGQASFPGALLRPLTALLRGPGAAPAAFERWSAFLERLRVPRASDRNEASDAERRSRRAIEVTAALKEIPGPALLIVDGAQFWDEVSTELLLSLAQAAVSGTGTSRSPLALALGYREEGPSAATLRELSSLLLEQGRATALGLGPLQPGESSLLFRGLGGEIVGRRRGLGVHQETGGSPARISALAGACDAPGSDREPTGGDGARPRLDRSRKSVAVTLELLGRPASAQEVAGLAKLPRRLADSALRELEKHGVCAPLVDDLGAVSWLAGPRAADTLAGCADGEVTRARLRIARGLAHRCASPSDPRLLESVRHFRLAGDRRSVLRYGLRAARYLADTFQNRSALATLEATLACLPAGKSPARLGVILEMAALHTRVGDHDQGIRQLEELLLGSPGIRRDDRKRAILQLAVLHSRKGDFKRADALFCEGLAGAPRPELVAFLAEHAAMKVFLGETDVALAMCKEGLRHARPRRDRKGREAALSFHAVRANLALRAYDFDAARSSLEEAMRIAVALGTLGSQAVILNNLAKVLSQEDRYAEAIHAFGEAERLCLRIDDGPSLAAIHGNMAVLQAKVGDFAAMDATWEKLTGLAAFAPGRREQFLLAHARGLCLLFRGSFQEAHRSFDEAIAIGKPLGDRHVVVFDELYRAECLVFEGGLREAAGELERIAREPGSAAVGKMALARLALARAFLGDAPGVTRTASELDGLADSSPVQFLDAWDGLLLAWAFHLCGKPAEAVARLDRAMSFLSRHAKLPLADLGRLLRAEMDLTRGGAASARPNRLAGESTGNRLAAAWRAILEAEALGPEKNADGAREQCASFLDEAGGALVGNPIPFLGVRLGALRDSLSSKDDGEAGPVGAAVPTTRAWRGPEARIVARSPGMARLVSQLRQIRKSEVPVLIQGETGSGKDLVARTIHAQSSRASEPFVVVDCASIPQGMLEAELFGARKGSYTGSTDDREGILRQAGKGTVFVDEVSNLSLDSQAKLLRAFSDRKARALGGDAARAIEARFIVSTSKDLDAEVEAGRFRRDLFHRVCVIRIEVPPLRERQEDLREIIASLLRAARKGHGHCGWLLEEPALRELRRKSWPGNVRELENLVSRLLVESPGPLTPDEVAQVLDGRERDGGFPGNLLADEDFSSLQQRLEREYVLFHYRRLGGDTGALCELLGLKRRQLYYRLKRLKLQLRTEKQRLDP